MKTKNKNSFVKICLIQFVLCSFLLLGLFVFANSISTKQLENSFPILDDFLIYEDYLKEERYDLIPIEQFSNCEFAIVNQKGFYLFATDWNIEKNISGKQVHYISDYYSNEYYYVLNKKDKNDKVSSVIFLNSYDEELETEMIKGYAELDENNTVIKGDIFPLHEVISDQDIRLLNGVYDDTYGIEKYDFVTESGKERSLLFLSPMISTTYYSTLLSETPTFWIMAICVMAIVIFLEAYFFNRRLKKPFIQLSGAISSYQKGESLPIEQEYLPDEFRKIVDKFNQVLQKLNTAEKEKTEVYLERQKIIANVSHDLKTPLTVISGYTKAFLDGVVPLEKQEKYYQTIYQKALYTSDLVDTLFEFTQMEHPDYKLHLKKVDFGEFCKEYLACKYDEIHFKKFHLKVEIPEDKVFLEIDQKLIKRLFENLINNSLDHNQEGVTIYFEMQIKKEQILLFIGDNGKGISEEIRKTIFMPFITSNEARTSGKGVGLGMSISRKIVELHHGSIELAKKDKSKYMTKFVITLPRK